MSHFKTFECKVDSVDFVKKALVEMDLGYAENTTIVDWAKQKRKVDLPVLKNGHLIPLGFVREKNELKLYADWFLTSFTEKSFTEKMGQLHDKYRVLQICNQSNWNVNEEDISVNSKGELEILATRWS